MDTIYKISPIDKTRHAELIDVWEKSVRATHHFLKNEDIDYYRSLIANTYLDTVILYGVKNNEETILGFIGVNKKN